MSKFLQGLLGVNWKTTLAGIAALLGVGAKIVVDVKTKDFGTFFSDAQSLLTDVSGIGIGLGLIHAKADNVTTENGVNVPIVKNP